MGKTVLSTLQDCEDLLEGALWMGTGGGGSYSDGINLLKEVLDEGLSIEWIDAESIPDDVWTVTVGLHGSIAPVTRETRDAIAQCGLVEAPGEWYISRAVRELEAYMGISFECLVPSELGPDSVAIPLAVGARCGIIVVDGDYIGRAVPEEVQSTYRLYGKQSKLFTSVDRWGNIAIVKDTANTRSFERVAKMLALAAFGDTAVATTPLVAREMKQIIVPATLTRCLKIGQAIRAARSSGENPINAALLACDGWKVFEGKVTGLETEDQGGYFVGTAQISGKGAFKGQSYKVWFKNENLVSWLNGSPWVCSPDLITFVRVEDGLGIYNAELKLADEVAVIGMQAFKGFRSDQGLKIAGPRYFGFEIDYVPIEDLVRQESAALRR